jgi:hypothetical protein
MSSQTPNNPNSSHSRSHSKYRQHQKSPNQSNYQRPRRPHTHHNNHHASQSFHSSSSNQFGKLSVYSLDVERLNFDELMFAIQKLEEDIGSIQTKHNDISRRHEALSAEYKELFPVARSRIQQNHNDPEAIALMTRCSSLVHYQNRNQDQLLVLASQKESSLELLQRYYDRFNSLLPKSVSTPETSYTNCNLPIFSPNITPTPIKLKKIPLTYSISSQKLSDNHQISNQNLSGIKHQSQPIVSMTTPSQPPKPTNSEINFEQNMYD